MNRKRFLTGVGIVVALYFLVSTTVYRFRHPDRTETQLFIEIPAALLWK